MLWRARGLQFYRSLVPASGAVPADLEARDHDLKTAIALQLALQRFESFADKFRDFPASQTCHVNMVTPQFALVEVTFAVEVHQVELVDQPLSLEQIESPVD